MISRLHLVRVAELNCHVKTFFQVFNTIKSYLILQFLKRPSQLNSLLSSHATLATCLVHSIDRPRHPSVRVDQFQVALFENIQ